jgi:hypothetical protein
MTERSAERRVRQETGWLAGGPLLRAPTIRRTTDTFHFISHTTNVLLFKSRCNIFIGVRINKEMPASVASGTPCISTKMQLYTVYLYLETALHVSGSTFTHHQERIQLYLQHLVFVTPLLLSAARGR